ncbi:MAG TPA: SDR family oxidoreductase [Steroidobacter sp.]|uniref:SDR family oxidoreductase n=1 Tax=Steroidobacter sp. TaxID=1978227 RepID=UPI002EDAA7A1
MQISGNTILITGGASGIGLRLAEELLERGNHVIVAARSQGKLDQLLIERPALEGLVLDVTDADAIRDVSTNLAQQYPDLNVLINNAGIMVAEDLTNPQADLTTAEQIVATNLLGPIRLTAALLPHLRRQPRSTIINVSSGLAFVPMACTPTYCATKAAVHSYTLSLRRQFEGTTTEVIELIPPSVRTDLMPGHATDPRGMPLDEFICEVMALLERSPAELCVRRVELLRKAEAEHRFEMVFEQLNPRAHAA